jgi:DNA-binding XRE family transcriptional regulator
VQHYSLTRYCLIIKIEVKTVAITQKTKQQFVELRAEGMSYDKIAKKLKVSKTTLIAWSREHEVDIDNLRTIATESLQERYKVGQQHRLELWSEQLEMVRQELKTRGLGDIPTPKLIELLDTLSQKLKDEAVSVRFKSEPYIKNEIVDFSKTKTSDYWNG